MKVKVRLLRYCGNHITPSETAECPAYAGILTVDETRDLPTGRSLTHAKLVGILAGTETNVLPDLLDARLLWAKGSKLRVSGFERINNIEFSQTWSVEVESC